MNTIDLKGKNAVVTGGARGIGLAIAQRFFASGAHVALWDIDEECATSEAKSLGGNAIGFGVDVTDWDRVMEVKNLTRSHLGSIDILVNSAGIAGPNAPLDQYPLEDWHQIIDINLNGTFHVNRAIIPAMKAQNYGRILNIASIAGKEGNPNASAYSASKAAVIAITKSVGKELADFDIAVNCLTPSAARTRIFEQMTQEHIDFMLSKVPRGRFVNLEEIAAMAAWLVSAENSFTTGGVFDISGGRATY